MSTGKIDVMVLVDTKWVGHKWEIISVAISYAQNVLLPKGIAKRADEKVKKEKAEQIAKTQKEKSEYSNNLKNIIDKLAMEDYTIIAQANAIGKLFAKIDNKFVAKERSTKYKVDILPDFITCSKIENTGEYEIVFRYETIKSKIKMIVKSK